MTETQTWTLVFALIGAFYVLPMAYLQIRCTRVCSLLIAQLRKAEAAPQTRKQRFSDHVVKHASLLAKDLIAQVIEQRKASPGRREFTVEFEPRTDREIAAATRGILKSSGWYPILFSDGKAMIAPSRREDVEKLRTSSADLAYQFDSDAPFEPARYADGSEPYVASPYELDIY